MKTLGKTLIIFLPLLVIIIPFSCDRYKEIYDSNVPSYMDYDDLRRAVSPVTASTLETSGKIALNKNHLFNFKEKEGIQEKNNVLYADSCIDLTIVDIFYANSLQNFDKTKNVFPYVQPQYDLDEQVKVLDLGNGILIAGQ